MCWNSKDELNYVPGQRGCGLLGILAAGWSTCWPISIRVKVPSLFGLCSVSHPNAPSIMSAIGALKALGWFLISIFNHNDDRNRFTHDCSLWCYFNDTPGVMTSVTLYINLFFWLLSIKEYMRITNRQANCRMEYIKSCFNRAHFYSFLNSWQPN